MSAARDVARASKAASSPFPPLEAALSLVSYIDQSISQFRWNKNEIKAIGVYSKQLSEQLQMKRHKPAGPTAGAAEDFCKIISNIHAYVKEVSKMYSFFQLIQRQTINNQLEDYRNQLDKQLEFFSIISDIETKGAERTSEEVRKGDTGATQHEFRNVSEQITMSNTGVSQVSKNYGLPETHQAMQPELHKVSSQITTSNTGASQLVVQAANAESSPFPPLEAAFRLVSYIDQNIAQFKSNRNEIIQIGAYSKELSQKLQLQRHKYANSTVEAAEDFCKAIADIHGYVTEVQKMHLLLQYFQRQPITDRLKDYRNQLTEQFQLFSIISGIEAHEAQKAVEEARKADMEAMQHEFHKAYEQITMSNTGVSQFSKNYGLSKTDPSVEHVLHEFEKLPHEKRTPEETTVLKESLELSRILAKSDYKWFSETFNATENSEFDIKNSLATGIDDCVRKLSEARLLASRTRAEINHQRNDLEKVTILFRSLNARPRDAAFIRSFQRAMYHDPEMRAVLNQSLKLTFEGEHEDAM